MMRTIPYITAAIAIAASVLAIAGPNAVHALLSLIVSLLALALLFYLMGAPFIAAMEIIIYAGAIMVLFVFAIMMMNLGAGTAAKERALLRPRVWIIPALLAAVLLAELIFVLAADRGRMVVTVIGSRSVGSALFSRYLLAVELAALLLLAGIVGAYHLGKRREKPHHRFYREDRP